MEICNPGPEHLAQLQGLWEEIFGVYDGFWDLFRETAFARERCLCILNGTEIQAGLCWLDGSYRSEGMAYVYAVFTRRENRGQGLCRKLLERTEAVLKEQGYAAALLMPAEPGLRRMYEGMGYRTCTWMKELEVTAGPETWALEVLDQAEFSARRRLLLPEAAYLQEGENLALLAGQAALLGGQDCLLTGWVEDGVFHGLEYLGAEEKLPEILTALGCQRGIFRMPGKELPHGMGKALKAGVSLPSYLGFDFA